MDRHRHGHRPHRVLELMLLWVVGFGGLWTLIGGISHISGQSHQLATSIGYAPSMIQWEVGWAVIAIGVLGVARARKSLRFQWMDAAVAVLAIPSDLVQPALAVLLLILYRRSATPADSPVRPLVGAGSAR